MLIIRKNQINNPIATVSMNKTLNNPYYLFSFRHITSKERVSFIPEVITSNNRYDKFRFVEGIATNTSTVPPTIHFEYLGQYYYSIYEQISSTNTDPALAYNKLESGRAVVIVGEDQEQECFYEPYISSNEIFENVVYMSEQEVFCISGDTTPVCPIELTGACPTYIARYSPINSLYYKNTGTTANFLTPLEGCAPTQIAMDESRMFVTDGCSNYYQYDYTITSGGCFTQTLVNTWRLWSSTGLTPNATYTMGIYDQDNLIVGAHASFESQTGSTLYLYNLTTSATTKWLEIGNNAAVTNVYYNTGNTQLLLSYYSASGGTGHYQLYSGSTSPQLIGDIPSTSSIAGGTFYFSGNTPIAVNVAGLQWSLDFPNQTITLLETSGGIPINYVDFGDGFDYISNIVSPVSCYTFDIPYIPPIPVTPTMTPTNSPTPSVTPTNTPSMTATLTPTPSSTPPAAITPNTYNALWWFDYTNASSLSVAGGSLYGAKNLATTGGFFSGVTGSLPLWSSTGYNGISGATQAFSAPITNELGLFGGSYSAYTTFARFNGQTNSSGNIQQSDNDVNYSGQTQGYRWWSLSDYLSGPPDFIRSFTFDTTGGSWTEPSFAYSGDVWYNVAVRTYQSGSTAVNEMWVNGSLVSQETNTATIRTSTDPIFALMSGQNYKTTEQFFIPSKLSDADMGVMFNYFNSKYV